MELEKLFAYKTDRIIDVIEKINNNALKTAFIVDNNQHLLGIVSDGDIRRAILNDIPLTTSIEEIMNKNPLVGKIGISEAKILDILLDKVIQIIPILDDNKKVVKYYHLRDFIKEKFLKDTVKESITTKQSKKVLIIGGAGYIGSMLSRILLEQGYFIRVLDNLTFGEKSIADLKLNPNFELIVGSYTNFEKLIPCLKNVDAVVHLAAIVGDPAGNIDPELTEEINYHGVKVLAEFCKFYRIQRLIFTSTCSVYGASNNDILNEESLLNPVSLYAETKLKAEKALLKAKTKFFHPCIIRLATVFGLSYRMRFDLVINLLTALSIRKKEISIFSGKQWRPFVHVKDVGRSILNILNQPIEKISGEIFNIGNDKNNFQIEDIGELLRQIFPDIKVNKVEEKEDKRSYRVSFNKAKEILNFSAENIIEDGIKEIANYMYKTAIDITDSQYSNYKNFQYGEFESISFFE
ncbi:MAG: NAD-dependent epimerase/dehydratase family protein [Promethearchaeota archaeon]